MFKSGFVAIIGRPNVGKSTLFNNLLGRKLSIITPKPQTTRNQIRGIYTTDECQIIFIDTPGIHKPQSELGVLMNSYSMSTFKDVDLILWIIDGTEKFGAGDAYMKQLLSNVSTPIFFVVNKMDLIKDEELLKKNVENFFLDQKFKSSIYISALKDNNFDNLFADITNLLEEGPKYYPEDQVSDHPEEFVIQELIREKILLSTKDEVPHSIAVVVDEMKNDENNLMNIRATIYVERKSQKMIIIGSNGDMIKKIGTLARKDIVMLLGTKIYLDLWVKVEEDWREKKNTLKRLGYFLEK